MPVDGIGHRVYKNSMCRTRVIDTGDCLMIFFFKDCIQLKVEFFVHFMYCKNCGRLISVQCIVCVSEHSNETYCPATTNNSTQIHLID